MASFGHTSRERLSTCDPRIQSVMHEAIKYTDFTVLCGHRGKEEQDSAYRHGFSKVEWPNSKHNTLPSRAVDIVPYPIDWQDEGRFHTLADVVKHVAKEMGVKLVWGGDWKNFKDLPHWELSKEEEL